MQLLRSVAPVLVLASLSCASIITGSEDTVEILSQPPGAEFTTNSGHQGTTPASITVPDELDLEVSYSLDEYEDLTVVSKARMSGWVWGNILLGGLIGLAIDFGTGNWKTHDKSVNGELVPVGGAPQS